jgi:prevent-host-death family protein
MAHNMAMKKANIAELKNDLSGIIATVEAGEEVEIRRRNVPVARLVPIEVPGPNQTRLGCGRGSAQALGDLTEPLIPESDWQMNGPAGSATGET